jgi:hypothetical protein
MRIVDWIWLIPILAVLLAIVSVGRAYRWLDSYGVLSHRKEASLTASGDWFVGESKTCTSSPSNGLNGKSADALSFLACDNGPQRQVSVEFWGRQDQPEYLVVRWKCTREESGFTCAEISGLREITVEELGRRVKQKYPQYQVQSDIDAGREFKAKFPSYSWVKDVPDPPQSQTAPEQQTPAPPEVGSIVSSYRFQGGDPADKSNWERPMPMKAGGRQATDEVRPEFKEKLDKIFGQPPPQPAQHDPRR